VFRAGNQNPSFSSLEMAMAEVKNGWIIFVPATNES
jgi:hypothetical protein